MHISTHEKVGPAHAHNQLITDPKEVECYRFIIYGAMNDEEINVMFDIMWYSSMGCD